MIESFPYGVMMMMMGCFCVACSFMDYAVFIAGWGWDWGSWGLMMAMRVEG